MAKMNQMPVASLALLGGILAHGRDDDAIAQHQIAKSDGGKEFAHKELPGILSV